MSSQDTQLHPLYESAYKIAYESALLAEPGEIVFIVGPTGAGKTRICDELREALVGGPERWPAGHVPLLYDMAVLSENSYFSSKDMFERILELLGDPFLARKLAKLSPEEIEKLRAPIRVDQSEKRTRRAALNLAIARRLRFLMIDEANLLCMTARSRSPEHHLEGLRVFCQKAGSVLVLAGTVKLLQLWNNSAQVNRKMHMVHVQRYLPTSSHSVSCVLAIVDHLVEALGLEFKPATLLQSQIGMVMTVTGGVFGEIRSLLRRMQINMNAMEEKHITQRVLMASLPAKRQVERLITEAQAIEMALQSWTTVEGKKLPTAPEEASHQAASDSADASSGNAAKLKRASRSARPPKRARARS